MTFEQKISRIRKQLQKPLPGKKKQNIMAPGFRGKPLTNSPGKNAAVLICLFPGDNGIQTVFIKRNEYDGPHGGQVSFPGGVFEDLDKDLMETAIRETKEEIGIRIEKNAILGPLSSLTIPVSNMHVYPFVGYYSSEPVFIPEKREVEYLIVATLEELTNPSCIQKEKWNLHGMEMEVPFYRVKNNIIWGATAMILCEFLAAISHSRQDQQFQY
jgi:8-oxo-dGTP pyrophosphatase MutT (NUDIX family)